MKHYIHPLLKITSILLLVVFSSVKLYAQSYLPYSPESDDPQWVHMMYADVYSIEEIINAYEAYYDTHEFVKNGNTQYYKRMVKDYMNGTGKFADTTDQYQKTINKFVSKSRASSLLRSSASEWECIGPRDYDEDCGAMGYTPGSAHVFTVEQSLSNTDVLYAGCATAGVWRSSDKALSWELITRYLPVNKVYAIEIDHTDENVFYFGAHYGKLYKTTNAGSTWNELETATFYYKDYKDIALLPNDNDVLFVATTTGLYRSSNAGVSFTKVVTGSILEINFHPTTPSTVYIVRQNGSKTEFHKSTDSGLNFTQKTNGWPNPSNQSNAEQKRTEIAVTPGNPNWVYALAGGKANGGSGTYGVYLSKDAGESWTFNCCGSQPGGAPNETSNPNLMGWQNGGDDGGQINYNMALAVTEDGKRMFAGAINIWHSDDDGKSFTRGAKWSHSEDKKYVHADIHDINIYGNDIWFACDGGIWYSNDNGETRHKRYAGIEGTELWGFGVGFRRGGDVIVGGSYHNGVQIKMGDVYNGGWTSTWGSEPPGGWVLFDHTKFIYHPNEYAKIVPTNRTQSLQSFTFTKHPSAHYWTGRHGDLTYDTRTHNTLYTGREDGLWRSADEGKTFTKVKDFGAGMVTSIEVAWTDPNVLYVATYNPYRVYKSTNRGGSWSQITPPMSSSSKPWDITVSDEDEDILWAAQLERSAGSSTAVVFKSADAGATWENITTSSLYGQRLRTITYQRGSNGGVYVGTGMGVFYKDNDMAEWEQFTNNLPYASATYSEVNYWKGKVMIGTNRSAYQCDFYTPSNPSAQILVDKTTVACNTDEINFYDYSALKEDGAEWLWEFPGGTPATSTEENPSVLYRKQGTYSVTLTVADVNGTSTTTLTDLITVTGVCGDPIDCNGVENGDAYIDDCGVCAGGDTGIDPNTACCNAGGTIMVKQWLNIDGNGTDLIPLDTEPDNTYELSEIDYNKQIDDAYGIQIQALLCPVETAEYRFFTASDDNSKIYLSTDATEVNKVLIGQVSNWVDYQAYTTNTEQKSDLILLEAGKQYYFEYLVKEGAGGDHYSVGWKKQGGNTSVLSAAFLSPYVPVTPCTEADEPNLLPQYAIDGQDWVSADEVVACNGQTVSFGFEGTDFNDWLFAWEGPNGFEQTNTGTIDSDEVELASVETDNAGTYTVSVTAPNGCSADTAFQLTINDNPIVDAGVDTSMYIGDSVTVTATGAVAYLWDNGLGTNPEQTLKPELTTTFRVEGTNALDCKATDSITITVLPLDVQTIQLHEGWNLVSTHILTDDMSIQALFSAASIVKNDSAFWKSNMVPYLNSLQEITPAHAYLVYVDNPVEISIEGKKITPVIQAFKTGWNYIGCAFDLPQLFTNVFADELSNIEIIKDFDGFHEPGNILNSITELKPGKGYLVKYKE